MHNQFGFKSKLGTDMRVYVLKELLHYYVSQGSQMYACFLDASRAFDRVNHTKLLSKLKTAGVPTYILRVICYWYCNQTMCNRWGSFISDVFTVTNGVRQGGILSPLLFNFYMNDLSVLLSKISAGCYSGNTVINHLMYTDDLVVFAPSAKGLHKLLNICDVFGKNNYNYNLILFIIVINQNL